MQSDAEVKRSYRSPLRAAQARATRAAIVRAALGLFVERGYAATPIDAIAEAAGVSRATVFTVFGSKGALLKSVYDETFAGDSDELRLIRRREARPVLAERDPERYLAAYVRLIAPIFERVAPIHEVVRAAATADAEAAEVWERISDERLAGSRRIVDHLRERGGLRSDLAPDAAADAIWVLNDPSIFHALVHRRGWSIRRYRTWLTDALVRLFLDPRPGDAS